jgi:predicted transcriptional regulator
MGRQASTLGSSVKSAYQAAPNIGLEIGLQKAGSVVKSGVTKVSSAASAAYNKVVSTELGYQAKLLVSPQERRQVAEYQKEGIKDLSLSLFGDHEGPGDILNLHQERQKTEALSRELQKEGLSKPAVKSYIDNKQNIRSKTDKNNEGIENLRKESEKINSELDTEILSIRLNNKSVDFRYLERDRLRVMQIEDPVEQNRAFKELQQKISAKKNGSLDVGMEKYEIIDGEIHDRGEWV